MDPFTILFHGTTEHQAIDNNQEVLHEITKLLIGEPYEDYLVCDGPGSFAPPTDNSWGAWWKSWGSDTPGTFDPYTLDKLPKSKSPAWSRTDSGTHDLFASGTPKPVAKPEPPNDTATTDPPKPGEPRFLKAVQAYFTAEMYKARTAARPVSNNVIRLKGVLQGNGMDDNIRHAIAVVQNALEKAEQSGRLGKQQPFTINLLGWSRGAVTCIRAANWFTTVYKDRVEINIFAFDPVPGGHLDLEDARVLGPAVKSYISVLCLDDRREPFRPIDMTGPARDRLTPTSSNIELALLPMPGVHSTPLYFGSNKTPVNGVNLHGCAEVARYLAWKFLKEKGSRLRPDGDNPVRNFSAAALCEKYAEMMMNLGQYATQDWGTTFSTYSQSGAKGSLPIERAVHRDRVKYTRRGDGGFFLNEHHLTAFAVAFPQLARAAGVVMNDLVGAGGSDATINQCPLTKKWLWQFLGRSGEPPTDSAWVKEVKLAPTDPLRLDPPWQPCLERGNRMMSSKLIG